MVVGETKRSTNIMDGIENTGDVRLHDHRLRLKQRFDIVRKLGQGTYGKVQLGINKKTGQEVAIKTIKKCKIETEADLIRIRREVQIMSSVRHPNIVHIYEVFENSEKMILVMEYCSGGELYDYLSQKKVLEEDEARRLFRQIATAVYYCHIHKICHRDLKLENVLLDETGSAKIADFGLSNVFKETSLLSTFCGSPLYASPEIVKGTPYIGPEVDCWSLGVLLYTLVYGAMPFDGSNFKRLVRQISNGDYYEPKNPSTASPLIRDMLTVDPLKRADIAYICDHSWVNAGCEASCLEVAEALAAETPVRLDLLLSLAPAAPSHSNSVLVPSQTDLGPEESCTDLTSSTSMPVEPSNSAEKRILELVAEGGEDAIKPSPTRTLVSAGEHKRKLDVSASGLVRKKERVASSASVPPLSPALPEEDAKLDSPPVDEFLEPEIQPTLKSSATITIAPSPAASEPPKEPEAVKETPKVEEQKETPKPKITIKKKSSPSKSEEKQSPEKQEAPKQQVEEANSNSVSTAADKLTSLSLAQPATTTPTKPKKLSIGGHVGSFKEQFERRASLTTSPEIKRNISKPVVSKIAKPKAQSEDRELAAKSPDNGTVRLQQIGIEPSPTPVEDNRRMEGGVKKTESEPSNSSSAVDPSVLLQDARRSLQNSMAKLVEERAGEDSRRRVARDIISSAIRTGKPPVPYGRSSSAGVATATMQSPPPATPPAVPPAAPRLFRTEAHHKVEDHRNRGVSVERIIPIHLAGEEPTSPKTTPTSPPAKPSFTPTATPTPTPPAATARVTQTPLRRLTSTESSGGEACSSPGEPIKKSAREFIIPIAVEGKGYVTPRQRSLEPEHAPHSPLAPHAAARLARTAKPRRISSLVSGGESEEEEESHMHRLRSSRAARADSVSSGEDDEEDEGFHLLTAENLFSTLLHRVRALTQRLNGEEGPGFQHPHSLFNNLQSPFFNSSHLPRRHLFTHTCRETKRSVSETREGWGSRELHAPFDSMFSKRQQMPRGSLKRTGKHQTRAQPSEEPNAGLDLSDLDLNSIEFSEREMAALSGLTPALSRRLQAQLLAHLPPRAASRLRRTLSLHADPAPAGPAPAPAARTTPTTPERTDLTDPDTASPPDDVTKDQIVADTRSEEIADVSASSFFTLPRLKRRSTPVKSASPNSTSEDPGREYSPKVESKEPDLRGGSVRSTPDRPLLSKYLTPERNVSVDDYSSDGGSILSEPSYIMAYGSPLKGTNPSFRRHSLRLSADQPRKRISRFLRPDFFDPPAEDNLIAKHKKEKELETQKILKEIREKKNRVLDSNALSSEIKDEAILKDEFASVRKCLSPIGNLISKERSRSTTPYYPILDNIKETILDTSLAVTNKSFNLEQNDTSNQFNFNNAQNKETKLTRPKSYPIKHIDTFDDSKTTSLEVDRNTGKEDDENNKIIKESRLIRPKSYPTSNASIEKTCVNRNIKNNEASSLNSNHIKNSYNTEDSNNRKEQINNTDKKPDVEVNFSITLPKRKQSSISSTEITNKVEPQKRNSDIKLEPEKDNHSSLSIKKYQVVNGTNSSTKELKNENTANDISVTKESQFEFTDTKISANTDVKKDDLKSNVTDLEVNNKKGNVKKKVIKKVSTKSKTDLGNNQSSNDSVVSSTEKKKVTKKIKEKDKVTDDNTKSSSVTKKKSVLQSIGHKLEKLATSKSNSPDKNTQSGVDTNQSKKITKLNRTQRENSVPVNIDPPTESNLIKRAVTITDVAALESQPNVQNKTTVSKVLGLFKKFEPKEKTLKSSVEKLHNETSDAITNIYNNDNDFNVDNEKDKVKRPSSLLLNGLGRKNRSNKTTNNDVCDLTSEKEQEENKKENDVKNMRNSLKLDFSRLPRVKKIVPTNPVIEPLIMNVSVTDKESSLNDIPKTKVSSVEGSTIDVPDSLSRSRSRSRSTFSNSDIKSEGNADLKNKYYFPDTSLYHLPVRNRDSLTPEKEDLAERIRRKSFYSRFNERKQRRKSSLVGPGASEYDPLARIHSQAPEHKYDNSPTSPNTYDLSPGYSVGSDISPSTERYKSILNDITSNTKGSSRYDGLNDKIDTYRSLDRNEFRKYPGSRNLYDYDQTSTYIPHRYSRTKSLFDSSESSEDQGSLLREPLKYNRTNSMYSPGNYATYRPKRTRNSAIILKESEKEPSPENILDKIRQRKISISVTRKLDPEKETLPRSTGPSKSEGDGTECVEKVD